MESIADVVKEASTRRALFKQAWKRLKRERDITFQGANHLDHPQWYNTYVKERDLTKGDHFVTEGLYISQIESTFSSNI